MIPRAFVLGALTTSLWVAMIAASARQTPSPQPSSPVFRSGIDLFIVEASVFDKDGHPAADLQPADFAVRVDGKPRKVLFARFYGGAPIADGTSADAPPGHVSNMAGAPGRAIVLVVDQESIRAAPADANGKMHAIEIKTTRPDVSVRSRPDVTVAARDAKASTDVLSDALRQPIDVTELPSPSPRTHRALQETMTRK